MNKTASPCEKFKQFCILRNVLCSHHSQVRNRWTTGYRLFRVAHVQPAVDCVCSLYNYILHLIVVVPIQPVGIQPVGGDINF